MEAERRLPSVCWSASLTDTLVAVSRQRIADVLVYFLLGTCPVIWGCGGPDPQEDIANNTTGSSATKEFTSGLSVGPISASGRKTPGSERVFDSFPRFRDVHDEAGVSFEYDNGVAGNNLMVESFGGGAGWLDYDRDGHWDLYLVQGGNPVPDQRTVLPPNQLFRNIGGGRFVDVSDFAYATDTSFGQGVAVGDYDDDGFDDIYIANVFRNVLYRNLGDGTFEDVAVETGVGNKLWSTSAAWSDLDLDGDLDLFVCNYLDYDPRHPLPCPKEDGTPGICDPQDVDPVPNDLFVNDGNGGFRSLAPQWGLTGEGSKSLGVAIADFNDDGLPDIFIANDVTANFLFVNQGGCRFRDLALSYGCAASASGKFQASMGVAFGDYDGNGFPDLYISHFTDDSGTLYANLGTGGFYDTTRSTGLHNPTLNFLGFGTVMADFNYDGHLDLFITNGHIDDWRDRGFMWQMPPQLFTFDGRRWQECTDQGGDPFRISRIGRAVASCDYDEDGDVDLAVIHHNAPIGLLNNESSCGHWLKLEFIGRISNRRGIGVKAAVTQGDRQLIQQLPGGTSFCAAHQPALFFGLGDSRERCTVRVQWPSGQNQELIDVSIDKTLVVMEPREQIGNEAN